MARGETYPKMGKNCKKLKKNKSCQQINISKSFGKTKSVKIAKNRKTKSCQGRNISKSFAKMFEHCKKQKKIKVARGETYPNHLQKCVSNTKIKVAREETYPNPSLQKCGGDSQLPSCQTCSKNSL